MSFSFDMVCELMVEFQEERVEWMKDLNAGVLSLDACESNSSLRRSDLLSAKVEQSILIISLELNEYFPSELRGIILEYISVRCGGCYTRHLYPNISTEALLFYNNFNVAYNLLDLHSGLHNEAMVMQCWDCKDLFCRVMSCWAVHRYPFCGDCKAEIPCKCVHKCPGKSLKRKTRD